MTSKVQIVKALQKLAAEGATVELVKGDGYWYFAYVVEATATRRMVYDTESVACMYLNSMPDERWIAEGRPFVERMNAELAEA